MDLSQPRQRAVSFNSHGGHEAVLLHRAGAESNWVSTVPDSIQESLSSDPRGFSAGAINTLHHHHHNHHPHHAGVCLPRPGSSIVDRAAS